MHRFFTAKKNKLIAGVLFGIQVFLLLLIPTSAYAVIPGLTPSKPGPGNNFCFTAGDNWYTFSTETYCYPNMASCTAGYAAVSSGQGRTTCMDEYSTRSGIEKFWNNITSNIAASTAKIGNEALDALKEAVLDAVVGIAKLIFNGASWFMLSMGSILDYAISRTVDSKTYANLASVNVGWTIIRDMSNMFFIFVLLYIAIMTILGLAGGAVKRWLAHIVIAALMINFSLFATQVVIDAGNVLAVGFWSKIQTTQGTQTESSASAQFLQGFRIQTTWDNKDAKNPTAKMEDLPAQTRLMIYGGGAMLMFIAGYVFLAGAIMMIIRTVTLIILMIVSPFAFLGFALPKGGGFAQQWLSKLIGASFVAPAFIFMLYISSVIIQTTDISRLTGADSSSIALAISGNAAHWDILYNYLVMIILLLASLTVAKKVGDGVGDSAGGWAKKAIGVGAGLGIAGTAIGGRQVVGRAGRRLAESDAVNKLAARKGILGTVGRGLKATGDVAQKSTFDIRNAPMKGLGLGAALGAGGIALGQGGNSTYEKTGALVGTRWAGAQNFKGTEKEKQIIETLKERYKNNPEALKAALESRFGLGAGEGLAAGVVGGGQLEKGRHKDLMTDLKKDLKKKEDKEAMEAHIKDVSGYDIKGLGKLKPEEIAKVNEDIKKKMADMSTEQSEEFAKGFAESLEKINSKAFADMGRGFLDLDVVQRNMTGQQLSEVHNRLSDGTLIGDGLEGPNGLKGRLSNNVMWNGTESAKRVMKNQVRQGNSNFIVDTGEELKSALTEADEEIRENKVRNVLGFMNAEDVAQIAPIERLAELEPYLTSEHKKAMGKRKQAALNQFVAEAEKAKELEEKAAQAAKETPLPKIMSEAELDGTKQG